MSFLYGKKLENEREFFTQKGSLIRNFNGKIFNEFMFFAFLTLFLLLILTFIPGVQNIHPLFKTKFRLVFFIYTFIYSLGMLCTYLLQEVIFTHPLPALYLLFFSLYTLALSLNMMNYEPLPYIVLIGFRMMFPVLSIDYSWRIATCNNLVMAAALFLSYTHKPFDTFVMDVITGIIFTGLGMVVGDLTLSNQIRYMETKEQQMDKDLEMEKAKNEAKNAFLANMSHEIRTPINSILGLDEMLLRESTDPKVIEYANNIKVSGTSLLKIINDILDFSKIEAGKLEIIPAEYELSSLIMDLVNMVSRSASTKRLDFTVHVDQTMPHLLYGDEVRVKQCILNILNNAIKYTEKGTVALSVSYERVDTAHIYLKVKVTDTGIGIKKEDMSRLFSAFERIEENRNRTIEGTGLGMSIVQMLLNKMGTRLEVKSEYGKGSEFSFAVKQRVVWWDQIGNFTERYDRFLHSQEAYHESFRAPEARILIVDDTKMNLVVMEGLLKQTQIKIDTALSGEQMLELVAQRHYDVIFIDYRMPNMDGVEAFHAMERLPDNLNAGVPCIALTANVVSGAREAFIKEGFADYLSKPVDSKLLETMLRNYLPPQLVQVAREQAAVAAGADAPREEAAPARPAQPAPAQPDEPQADAVLAKLSGLDMQLALQNCGSPEVLMVALKEYYAAIRTRIQQIEQFVAEHDYKNYTVQVHALKSSSRLIGITELGEQAAYLEQCGDRCDEAEIAAKTPAMLELYSSYLGKLAALSPEAQEQPPKPELPAGRYKEALAAIQEFARSFDFNAVDSIIQMLDGYAVPRQEEERYAKIKRYASAGDSSALLELLKE